MEHSSRLHRWGLIFLGWSLIAIFYVFQAQLYLPLEAGRPVVEFTEFDWPCTILWELTGWYLWGLFSILIYRLAKRYPLQKKRLMNVLILLILAPVFATAHAFIHVAVLKVIDRFMNPAEPLAPLFLDNVRHRIMWRLMVYFAVLAASHILLLQKSVNEERQRTARLEVQLAQAQLEALKMQLQPHFLFNTLQSISELMHQDIDLADEMMVRLAHFLR